MMVVMCCAALALVSSPKLFAQVALPEIENRESIPLPADFSRVSFYLLTVDVGDNVWDNFGHTALRVVDEASQTDLVFNWGLFDASVGYVTFAANFMRGIMDYQLGVSPPHWELGRYQQEQRSVWQDQINLTEQQKSTLYQRLAWNLRDENIVYAYDYFFDNCTTRVRDYLDEALQGDIFSRSQAFSSRTFRDEVQFHYETIPVIALSLDVLMNGRIDRRMRQWERMFLPLQLRDQLSRLPSDVMQNGRQLPLLSDGQVLMEFDTPEAKPDAYYFVAGLFIPMLFLFSGLRRNSIASFSSQPGYTLRSPSLNYRLLGIVGLLIALFSGIYGLIMTLGWLGSSHLDMHHNINLLLFWPTDLLGVFIALGWLFSGRQWSLNKGKYQLVYFYLLAHAMAALVYLFIGLLGLTEQDITSLMIFMVPLLLLFTVLVLTAGLRPVRKISF